MSAPKILLDMIQDFCGTNPVTFTKPLTIIYEGSYYNQCERKVEAGERVPLDRWDLRTKKPVDPDLAVQVVDTDALAHYVATRKARVAANQLSDVAPALRKPVLEETLVPEVLGPVPSYSDLAEHPDPKRRGKRPIHDVGTSTGGAFAVLIGYDVEAQDFGLLLIQRGDDRYGVPGGYFGITQGEQPQAGVAREVEEELKNDRNEPVLKLNPERLVTFSTGMDVRRNLRTQFHPHLYPLDGGEIDAVKQHVKSLAESPDYAAKATKFSGGETKGAQWLTGFDNIANFVNSVEFTHPHEKERILFALEMIKSSAELQAEIKGYSSDNNPPNNPGMRYVRTAAAAIAAQFRRLKAA